MVDGQWIRPIFLLSGGQGGGRMEREMLDGSLSSKSGTIVRTGPDSRAAALLLAPAGPTVTIVEQHKMGIRHTPQVGS